jgi:hypothetical protein
MTRFALFVLLVSVSTACAAPNLKEKPKEREYDLVGLSASTNYKLDLSEGAQDHADFPSLLKLLKGLGLETIPKDRILIMDEVMLITRFRETPLKDVEWKTLLAYPLVKGVAPIGNNATPKEKK